MTRSDSFLAILAITSAICGCDTTTSASQADSLVQQLRDLPAALGPQMRSDGRPIEVEVERNRLYAQLYTYGEVGVLALGRGLRDADVRIRRNAALALSALASGYVGLGDTNSPELDISPALPQIVAALRDEDQRVKAMAAHAISRIGPSAESAVPFLIEMLESNQEGLKNTACIGLRGIGPPARAALPELREALSDTSEDVRRFAQLAIESIEQD